MPRILTDADIADFRERLCNVAALLFAEKGHEGFNMRELAKRLGVSAMTPYRYFPDKDAILAEVRARAFGAFADCLEDALAASPRLPLADAYLQFAVREQIQYRLMFDLSQKEPAPAPFSDAEKRARAAILAHARSLGATNSADPDSLALSLWSVLHGAVALFLASKISSKDLHQILWNNLSLIPGAAALETQSLPFEMRAGIADWNGRSTPALPAE